MEVALEHEEEDRDRHRRDHRHRHPSWLVGVVPGPKRRQPQGQGEQVRAVPLMKIRGSRKEFPAPLDVRSQRRDRGDRVGTTICEKMREPLAPSIRAASSISVGNDSKNCFIRKMPKRRPGTAASARRYMRRAGAGS